jgi:2-haloacid dehalogenase
MTDLPFKALTFDCFGTLVDWRKGQQEALGNLPALADVSLDFVAVDAARLRVEVRLLARAWRPYAEILAESILAAVREVHGVVLSRGQCLQFAHSQARWPAFPDSVAALGALATRYRLALLSNCDAEMLAASATQTLALENPLLVSSELVRSYKPRHRHWEAALGALHCQPQEVLHVSAYAYYDLIPALELGLKIAWVKRDNEQQPDGLPLAFVATDLVDLAKQMLSPSAR